MGESYEFMNGPWPLRIAVFSVLVGLARLSPGLVWLISIGCLSYAGYALYRYYQSEGSARGGSSVQEVRATKLTVNLVRYQSWQEMAARLNAAVIGQKDACDRVAETLFYRMQMVRDDRPLGVYCLAGPPGVGKTLFAKELSKVLFGTTEVLVHIDMTQYSSPSSAAALFGAPRGMGESTGILVEKLLEYSRCVVLLDEFEKADGTIHNRFLTAWSDGFISDPSMGKMISTHGAIFIITTNEAADRIRELSDDYQDDPEERIRAARSALKGGKFTEAVLDRIEDVFPFKPLRGLDAARLCATLVNNMVQRQGMSVVDGGISEDVLLDAVVRHERTAGSVRDVQRRIEEEISAEISTQGIPKGSRLAFRSDSGKIRIDVLAAG